MTITSINRGGKTMGRRTVSTPVTYVWTMGRRTVPTPVTYVCRKCGKRKVVKRHFHKSPGTCNGIQHICKACRSEYMKKFYKKNKERICQRTMEWVRNNKAKHRAIQKRYLKKKSEAAKALRKPLRKPLRPKKEQNNDM